MSKGFDPNLVTQFLNEYQDRGMLKWQGFYLSDHTVSLNKLDNAHQAQLNRQHSKQLSSEEVQTVINTAITKHLPVRIELDIQDTNGYIAPFIEGRIEGYFQDKLVVNSEYIALDEIYAVSMI